MFVALQPTGDGGGDEMEEQLKNETEVVMVTNRNKAAEMGK